MTQIDFYILTDNNSNARELFACKLTDKAYHLKHNIYIQTADQALAQQMDELLWTYNQGSFIPHDINSGDQEPSSPIMVGFADQPTTFHDVLINLNNEVPAFFSQFERVAEIVAGDDAVRSKARQRYKYYRDRGYSLNTHNIG